MLRNNMPRMALLGALTAASLLAALPARAAIELEPGLWQDTEIEFEDGKPAKPEVSKECIKPEDAKDPVKALSAMKAQAGQCKTVDVKQSGNTVSFVMQCGDPKQMSIDIAATYVFLDRRRYTGTIKSTIVMAGRKSASETKVESVWIGACNK